VVDRAVIKEKISYALGLSVLGIVSFAGLMTALRWATTIWHYKATGVDNTDEGYYLSAVLFPHQIPHAPTDFAFYLRPLWIIFGQNLPAYRVGGFLLIVAVSIVLAFELQRWVVISRRALRALFIAITSTSLVGALAYQYVLWIPTPNYNLLGLCILALASAALLAVVRQQTLETTLSQAKSQFEWTVESWAGLVLFTIFATRVTAGLILGVVLMLFFLQSTKFQLWRKTLGGVGLGIGAGVLIHSLLTLRPPWRSMKSWSQSLELSQLRKDHSSKVLWEYDFFSSHVWPWLLWALVLIVSIKVIRLCVPSALMRRTIALAIAVLTLMNMWSARPSGGIPAIQNTVGWWWLRLVIYALMLSMLIPEKISRKNSIGPAVAVLGIAGAVGSANGLYHQLIFTAGLLMIAVIIQLLILIHQSGWKFLVVAPLSLFLLVFASVGLTASRDTIKTPYRTVGTITDSSQLTRYGTFGNIYVHPNSAAFVSWLADIKKVLPPTTTCIVNLEGATPVVSPLLNVRPVGTNWNLGSYPGSTEASARSLELDTCWKNHPFLLIDAPTGETALPVPEAVQALCKPPFTTFELNTDHKALMRASLCNQAAG
jgi:hypothetical protein